MPPLFECVPNFSEGRDQARLELILAEIRGVPGVALLDVESDPAHNRSVVTLVGPGDALVEAAFRAARKAAQVIDLNQHKGEHPRMGATDVIPFIPIRDASMADAVALARKLGERMGRELEIPVFFYQEAATRPARVNLADVRKGEFEGLHDLIGKDPEKAPDCGPARIHPTAGATAVGAREYLIAFNINLQTRDLAAAKAIAKSIRESSGGFPCVKALGFELADRGIVQVSMNMTNYKVTSLCTAYDKICELAAAAGVGIIESEIVGMVPAQALTDTARRHLRIANFSDKQIIENRLAELSADALGAATPFLDSLASAAPAPGGGSASALAAAMGAALNAMVCNLTVGKKKFVDVEAEAKRHLAAAEALRAELQELIRTDARAFDAFGAAMALPKDTDEQKAARATAMQAALTHAAEVPLQVMQKGLETVRLAGPIRKIGNPNALSDVAVGALMAAAGIRGAHLNILINLGGIQDKQVTQRLAAAADAILAETDTLERELLASVRKQLQG